MNRETQLRLIERIKSTLADIPAAPGFVTRRERTAKLKSLLLCIGEAEGFDVCPHSNEPQWLFDFIWYQVTGDTHQLRNIVLAVEMEWDPKPGSIRYDFEKLLVSKAPLKLMIYEDCRRGVLDELKRSLLTYTQPTDAELYILAEFIAGPPQERGFRFHVLNSKAEAVS